MTTQTCPDQATLEQLLLGRLSGPKADELEAHLSRCDACATVADALAASDDWIAAIRARTSIAGDDDTLASVIERGCRLGSRLHSAHSVETVSIDPQGAHGRPEDTSTEAGPATTHGQDDGRFDFLAPPELPDEIGRLGGYRVLEVLGTGGMGVVFRAEDPRLKRLVALKAMKPSIAAAQTAKDRFLREAQATAAIEHDNIVAIHQVGEEGGVPFIAMQFLRGESLQTRLRREGRLAQREVLRIGREVAAGLAAAHARGLIHRDIKPDNIWLEAVSRRVKILDFGLARLTNEDAGLTQSGTVLGTPRYMAPEQALGEAVDHRCDLFSLGCVLYHLAAGRAPFSGANVTAMLLAVVHQDPEPIEMACPGIDPRLARLIGQLLTKDRDARPASADELADRLATIEQGLDEGSVGIGPTREPADDRPAITRRLAWLGGGIAALAVGILLALWAAGIIFRLETEHGTLVVKATGDDFATTILGQTVTIENVKTTERFTVKLDQTETTRPKLKPGDYRFVLETESGLRTTSKRFTINAGQPSHVEVWWEPAIVAAAVQTTDHNRAKSGQSDDQPGQRWHGWPAAAPPPAIAPFDAAKASAHQQAWAEYLGVPVEYENSIGMRFRLIPPGEFLMGAAPEQIELARKQADPGEFWSDLATSEGPLHRVVLTQPVYLGAHEVTQQQYLCVMGSNPSYFSADGAGKDEVEGVHTATLPVDSVSWNDAAEFCEKLSTREQRQPIYIRTGETVAMFAGTGYRLPTEAEWEFACRAGTTTRFWTGDEDSSLLNAGWFNGNSKGRTHAVGELRANPLGLFDIPGNVWEWVQDIWERTYYEQFVSAAAIDPTGPSSANGRRVLRGARWQSNAFTCRASNRLANGQLRRDYRAGFRVALPIDAVKAGIREQQSAATGPTARQVWPDDDPPPAIAPFDADQAKKHQEEWAAYLDLPVEYTNSIGMQFRLIPPGEFTMGSPDNGPQTAANEKPSIKVAMTEGFCLGQHEVTQGQWKQVMKSTPWSGQQYSMDSDNAPVSWVGWRDAVDFCQRLTKAEHDAGRLPAERQYSLPTEAKWEYACRAGTTTRYHFGEDGERLGEYAWTFENAFSIGDRHMHEVGGRAPNAWGLYDMHGNAWELCLDWHNEQAYADYPNRSAINPAGPATGTSHVLRGGSWFNRRDQIKSALRGKADPERNANVGFRVMLSLAKAVQADVGTEAATPATSTDSMPAHDWPADAPPPASAPFDAEQAKAHQEAWAAHLGVPVEYENEVGMRFRLIPPGECDIGTSKDELEGLLVEASRSGTPNWYLASMPNETPRRRVRLTRPYYMAVTEVTQSQFREVVDAAGYVSEVEQDGEGGFIQGDDGGWKRSPEVSWRIPRVKTSDVHPVVQITWNDAQAFCRLVSERTGGDYHLPTDAQWRFAARAGATSRYYTGDDAASLYPHAWFSDFGIVGPQPVAARLPNAFGLYDIHGNVWEWCADFHPVPGQHEPLEVDPTGPADGSRRVLNGGCWGDPAFLLRIESVHTQVPQYTNWAFGFRVVLSVDSAKEQAANDDVDTSQDRAERK